MNRIDLRRVPVLDRGHVFLSFEEALRTRFAACPPILDRLENGLKFVRMVGGQHESRFRSALVRAALTELVSVEDIQRSLNRSGGLPKEAYRLTDAQSPLLAVPREMRNVDIHLCDSSLSAEKRDFLWGNVTNPGDAIPVQWNIHWVDNLRIDTFRDLRNFAQKYDLQEFSAALQWFDTNQREWGIVELLFRAFCMYAEEVADHHALQ